MKTYTFASAAFVALFTVSSLGLPFAVHTTEAADPVARSLQYEAQVRTDTALVSTLTDYLHYLQLTDILHLQAVAASLRQEVAARHA